jgi:hypothetical protein
MSGHVIPSDSPPETVVNPETTAHTNQRRPPGSKACSTRFYFPGSQIFRSHFQSYVDKRNLSPIFPINPDSTHPHVRTHNLCISLCLKPISQSARSVQRGLLPVSAVNSDTSQNGRQPASGPEVFECLPICLILRISSGHVDW